MTSYDVVVIGAGITGSSAAYHLAVEVEKKGQGGNVLLLEQFSLLHTKGSSHGESRITRRAYEEPYYVHMMDESFRLWEQIERESGNKIYTKTGILAFGKKDYIEEIKSSLEANDVGFEKLTGDEANKRWPNQLKLPSSYSCVLEQDGGILSPMKALSAYQTLYVKHGGIVWDNCPVTDIIPGDTVRIITSKGEVLAKNVILTVGPWAQKWANKLNLQHLSFKAQRAEVFYWRAENPELFEPSKLPVFYIQRENRQCIYGLPIYDYPGLLKICNSLGPAIATPEERDKDFMTNYRDQVSEFIREHLKGVSTESEVYEACIVTHTPTKNPVLDRHPLLANIIFGMGLSGHGFKLSPVYGKILCMLAMGENTIYDLTPFKIAGECKE